MNNFNLSDAVQILEQTPGTLRVMLSNLSEGWIYNNEGAETWSPFDVVGHLVHGEKTDWITRTKTILEHGENKTFEPFDRFAQFEDSKEKSLSTLLNEFETLRKQNLKTLDEMNLKEDDFEKRGEHPGFGTVMLRQLLSTWAVHDLNHISQIVRVMAHQYKSEVGPWQKYLRIVKD
jgi:uncharacterized damage-inducible protein DinB